MAKMLLILIGILSCVNAQEIDCYRVIPTIESMVREVSNSIVVSFWLFQIPKEKIIWKFIFQVEIELNEGTAVVQGSTHRLPLTQIVRVYHQNCCQNILMSSNGRCPTLNWRSLTNYLDFIAVLESQANMKFPSNEVSQFWKIECLIHHFPDIFFQDGWKLFFFS